MVKMARPTKTDPDQPPEWSTLDKLDPILEFICHSLVGLKEDSPVVLAMRQNGVLDVDALLYATEGIIKEFVYTPG